MQPNWKPILFAGTAIITAIGLSEVAGTADLSTSMLRSASAAEESAMETQPPFGGPANVAYAEDLWMAMMDARLVGDASFRAKPYQGQEPHGAILVTLEGLIDVQGQEGLVIVKKNYVAPDITVDQVANNPERNLDSITVMYKREAGYDPDHANWYWAKYLPDGSLDTNPQGMAMAGRVAKGADQGCIACHAGAPGGDYVFTHDRLAGN